MRTLILLMTLSFPCFGQMHIIPDMRDINSNAQKINDNFNDLDMNKIDKTDAASTYVTKSSVTSNYLQNAFYDRGDPAGYDVILASVTTDGAWHDLDLSGYIPVGSKAVLIRVSIKDDAVDSAINFRKNGNTKTLNAGTINTQVANYYISQDMIIPCDVNRVIEYLASSLTFTDILVIVKGYFK